MKNVMIVDDSLIMRRQLKNIFEHQGFTIVGEAVNGMDAVAKYTELKPDLVTMDITMPVMDGISAMQEICHQDPNACVIMISALGQEIKIIEAINKGSKPYIGKPLDAIDVLDILDTVFGKQREVS
jgi:two-component system chemotaxis response regulator CheY